MCMSCNFNAFMNKQSRNHCMTKWWPHTKGPTPNAGALPRRVLGSRRAAQSVPQPITQSGWSQQSSSWICTLNWTKISCNMGSLWQATKIRCFASLQKCWHLPPCPIVDQISWQFLIKSSFKMLTKIHAINSPCKMLLECLMFYDNVHCSLQKCIATVIPRYGWIWASCSSGDLRNQPRQHPGWGKPCCAGGAGVIRPWWKTPQQSGTWFAPLGSGFAFNVPDTIRSHHDAECFLEFAFQSKIIYNTALSKVVESKVVRFGNANTICEPPCNTVCTNLCVALWQGSWSQRPCWAQHSDAPATWDYWCALAGWWFPGQA